MSIPRRQALGERLSLARRDTEQRLPYLRVTRPMMDADRFNLRLQPEVPVQLVSMGSHSYCIDISLL